MTNDNLSNKTQQLSRDIEKLNIVLESDEMTLIDKLIESKQGNVDFCKSLIMYIVCKHVV